MKLTCNLMAMLISKTDMITKSVTGRKRKNDSDEKEGLDPNVVAFIIGEYCLFESNIYNYLLYTAF